MREIRILMRELGISLGHVPRVQNAVGDRLTGKWFCPNDIEEIVCRIGRWQEWYNVCLVSIL